MSHYSIYKTKLGNISAQLLQKAIESFAKQVGLQAVTQIRDYYGQMHKVTIGLTGQGLQNGIGFSVDAHGNMQVHGDGYNQPEWSRISNLAENYVKAYKVAQNAQMNYPAAQVRTKVMQKEVLLEVNL